MASYQNSVTRTCTNLWTEIRPGLFISTFELQGIALPLVNLYALVEPGKRALVIDAGNEAFTGTDVFDNLVDRFDLSWADVDVFLTHFHDDHCDNLGYLLEKGISCVYCQQPDPLTPERYEHFLMVSNALAHNERGDEEIVLAMRNRAPLADYADRYVFVDETTTFDLAGYHLHVLPTPGHAPEHLSLVDHEASLAFTGDHLEHGMPLISAFGADEHVVSDYLTSLDRLEQGSYGLILPAHCAPFDAPEAIQDVFAQTRSRFAHVITKCQRILATADYPTSVYGHTIRSYAGRGEAIEDVDPMMRRKRLAIQLAYLEHLCELGLATRTIDDEGVYRYTSATH